MQQQMNQQQQEQCGNQQFQQPVMLCPVQYVYEAPAILPQPQEDQQQNQIVINVKNPPPWIQNRTQNQVVYVQQVPNNYQTYIHPQMIQNPMYHQQLSYQIQPMLTQDNRQFIQIPHYNTVQNPPAQISNEEAAKMPLLTQMLNQKTITNKAPNMNSVRPRMTTAVNMIRPITHNQQVQTDKVSPNIKGRPRNVPPQIITINPMQQRQLTNQKQEAVINVRPTHMRNDVPQHIRTKIPSSISVKTITRPLLPRTLVRPFDVMPAPQNFYYNSVMPVSNPEVKNIMTNTESQHMKPNNFQENPTRTTVSMQHPIPISNVPPFVNVTTAKTPENIVSHKQGNSVNTAVKTNANPDKLNENCNNKATTETITSKNTETQTQTEEKLIRNTVYVQARGRVLNDKEIVPNQSLKRTIDNRVQEESKQKEETNNNDQSPKESIHISKKIKVEITGNSSEANKNSLNSLPALTPMNIQAQQSRISNLQMNPMNLKSIPRISSPNKINNVSMNVFKSEDCKFRMEDKNSGQSNSLKADLDKENNLENIKTLDEISDKVNYNSVSKEEPNDNTLKTEGKITVLTHVLEGYIIQESNFAFPIQKPMTEKEIKKEQMRHKTHEQNKVANTSKTEDSANEKPESKGHFPRKYLNTSIESDNEMEFAVRKDDPFANVKKSTVESWTVNQLASHLEKYNWMETANKLLDEEIDGESILLVNKDQLVAIGVSEEHAEVIVAFASS